jgi:serine/threonine protein phosphatase PrpC
MANEGKSYYTPYRDLGIEVFSAQHIGGARKRRQEDVLFYRAFTKDQPLLQDPQDDSSEYELTILSGMIADGMGGHHRKEKKGFLGIGHVPAATGKTASVIAAHTFRKENPRDFAELYSTAEAINEAIYPLNKSRRLSHSEKIGTTLIEIVLAQRYRNRRFLGYRGYTLNVGNSRELLVRCNGTYDQLTVDEVVTNPKKPSNEIIYNSVGQQPNIVVYTDDNYFQADFNPSDSLLLCSDGITRNQTNEEMTSIILSEKTLPNAGRRLMEQSLRKEPETADNLSLLLVRFY